MQLFCPACQGAFAGTQRCPRCGGLLLLPQEAAEVAAPRVPEAAPATDAPVPAGRVAVGALLALGMYLGLRKLAMGAVLATQDRPEEWWSSLEGLSAVCGAQILAVLFGAAVAAAGRAGGLGFGAVVGALCGAGFLAAELLAGAPAQDLVLYVQAVVLAAAGAGAGVVAARVWGAVPALDLPVPDRARLSSSRFALEKEERPERPTAWLRVLLGAMMMVLAVAAADKVRTGAQRYSGGMLRVDSVGQGRFLSWQLAVLGVLAGAATAAAGTGAGARHGVLAGVFSAAGVLGMTATAGESLAPVAYWQSQLSLGSLPPGDPAAIAAAAGGMLLLGLVGGWLGGLLFLPLAPEHLRNRPDARWE
jgi:hypothetical protein